MTNIIITAAFIVMAVVSALASLTDGNRETKISGRVIAVAAMVGMIACRVMG